MPWPVCCFVLGLPRCRFAQSARLGELYGQVPALRTIVGSAAPTNIGLDGLCRLFGLSPLLAAQLATSLQPSPDDIQQYGGVHALVAVALEVIAHECWLAFPQGVSYLELRCKEFPLVVRFADRLAALLDRPSFVYLIGSTHFDFADDQPDAGSLLQFSSYLVTQLLVYFMQGNFDGLYGDLSPICWRHFNNSLCTLRARGRRSMDVLQLLPDLHPMPHAPFHAEDICSVLDHPDLWDSELTETDDEL